MSHSFTTQTATRENPMRAETSADVTLPERLMPVGHEALYSLRQLVVAGFATTAGRLWPEARVPLDMPEEELWPHIRKLTDTKPHYARLLQEKHPIVHAWLYGHEPER